MTPAYSESRLPPSVCPVRQCPRIRSFFPQRPRHSVQTGVGSGEGCQLQVRRLLEVEGRGGAMVLRVVRPSLHLVVCFKVDRARDARRYDASDSVAEMIVFPGETTSAVHAPNLQAMGE